MRTLVAKIVVGLIFISYAMAYDNGAPHSRLPVMGWSSWVALSPLGEHPIFDYCDESSVKTAADSFVSLGFPEYGYHHFHLDDCWANKKRNSTGYLEGETDHFPDGMKSVVDHVHDNGLTFGLYTCAGTHTCVGGRPGSKDNWQKDADVFAEWGVDWVKMDNCNTDGMGKPETYYPLMSAALNKTGRQIHFNMCEWGKDAPWEWGPRIAQSWRATGDHTPVWESTKQIIQQSAAVPAEYSGHPYAWNDMDMLETGNYEQAAHANGKEGTMTPTEYKTEFSMWAISASPLTVTTPIMNCTTTSQSKCHTVSLRQQHSTASCTDHVSFGCSDDGRMFTDKGCRGEFICNGLNTTCDLDGQGRHFCSCGPPGPAKCQPWISDLQKEILFNKEIIAINQDVTPQGRPVKDGDMTLWTRQLSDGSVAVALYNEEDQPQHIGFDAATIGLGSGQRFSARDLWKHVDLGTFDGKFAPMQVEPHQSVMLRVHKQ